MAPCLWKDPFRGIQENHGKVRRGRARGHVAGVLFVPWSIRDDEFSPGGREITVGYVDGDALFAFRAQAVRQQRKVDWSSRTVDAALPHRGQLVFVDRFRVMEQPPDQR